jgi:threonine dehydrogenase-like Zn-dependent dehydrogenase
MTMVAMATMRAAVIEAPGRIRLDTVARPEPGAGQIRIRLEGSGVCASSLPLWEGRDWFDYPHAPGAPGHEGWGVVEEVGPEVQELAVGDRVAALSRHAFAEFDLASVGEVVRIPVAFRGRPFPAEPLGCAMNIFRRADIAAGQDVAIVGIGFLGALLVRLCAHAGARVIAISRRPFALDVARQLGASECIGMNDHWRIVERVRSLTGDRGCTRVIEAVGAQWPLDLASELTGERGRLVIAGYHQDGPRQVDMQLWNWRGLDVVNAHEREPAMYLQGMRDAIRATQEGVLDPWSLCTHRFPLDGVGDAFGIMRTRPDGFLKAWVTA